MSEMNHFSALEGGHERMLAFFQKHPQYIKTIKEQDSVFEEWESNLCFYVLSGEISICQKTASGEKKEIGYALEGDLLGEGVLFWKLEKKAIAIAKTELKIAEMSIDDLETIKQINPAIIEYLFLFSLKRTNERLMYSGQELALMYDIMGYIGEKDRDNDRWLCDILCYIKKIFNMEFVILVEKHLNLDMLFYRFNTTFPSVFPVNSPGDGELELLKSKSRFGTSPFMGTRPDSKVFSLKLEVQGKVCGYLLFGKKEEQDFDPRDIRMIDHLCRLLSSVVHTLQLLSEQKAVQRLRQNTLDSRRNFV